MTDHQQPEALRLADWLDAVGNGSISTTAAAAELRRLHAENEVLRKTNALQPIESAPKDGREIGVWSAKRPGVVQLVRWGHPLGKSIYPLCWVTATKSLAVSNIPTHWASVATPQTEAQATETRLSGEAKGAA